MCMRVSTGGWVFQKNPTKDMKMKVWQGFGPQVSLRGPPVPAFAVFFLSLVHACEILLVFSKVTWSNRSRKSGHPKYTNTLKEKHVTSKRQRGKQSRLEICLFLSYPLNYYLFLGALTCDLTPSPSLGSSVPLPTPVRA